MASAAGLLNRIANATHAQAANQVSATASSQSDTSTTDSTSKSTAGITANDFLTLLVTEMKNQDPTANTDPNEYINQLVNVNSLQQLISINETLTDAYGATSTSSYAQQDSAASVEANGATQSATSANQPLAQATTRAPVADAVTAQSSTADGSTTYAFLSKLAHGNLSIPEANSAADRLSHALSGHAGKLSAAK
jgi:flagellar basal-body rod modification protein FlgD